MADAIAVFVAFDREARNGMNRALTAWSLHRSIPLMKPAAFVTVSTPIHPLSHRSDGTGQNIAIAFRRIQPP